MEAKKTIYSAQIESSIFEFVSVNKLLQSEGDVTPTSRDCLCQPGERARRPRHCYGRHHPRNTWVLPMRCAETNG